MGFCSSSVGIIPAYAGSTIYLEQPHLLNPDHPRIRGEHLDQKPPAPAGGGSSPHTRGAPALFDPGSAWIRIIPAYAGSTITVPFRCCSGADHPRIRGEHDEVPDRDALAVGSSPHTRGALKVFDNPAKDNGIIPAYAGSTNSPSVKLYTQSGSSPHTRGAPRRRLALVLGIGIIPAYAGSTIAVIHAHSIARDHPRIRGEHSWGGSRKSPERGSSPHTRGALRRLYGEALQVRIIPAYAGSTAKSR